MIKPVARVRPAGLTPSETQGLQQFRTDLCARLGRAFEEIRLFGSKARGDSRPGSDIDVLVIVGTDDWHMVDTVYDIATDIQLDHGLLISPKVISRRHFDRCQALGTSFINNVINEGVPV